MINFDCLIFLSDCLPVEQAEEVEWTEICVEVLVDQFVVHCEIMCVGG